MIEKATMWVAFLFAQMPFNPLKLQAGLRELGAESTLLQYGVFGWCR